MNMIKKLSGIITFSKRFSTLTKCAKRLEKNLNDLEFNANFISNQFDTIDKLSISNTNPLKGECKIQLTALSAGTLNLKPITQNQILKKQLLIEKCEDLNARFTKIRQSREITIY